MRLTAGGKRCINSSPDDGWTDGIYSSPFPYPLHPSSSPFRLEWWTGRAEREDEVRGGRHSLVYNLGQRNGNGMKLLLDEIEWEYECLWQDRKGVKAEARVSMDPLDALPQQQNNKRQKWDFLAFGSITLLISLPFTIASLMVQNGVKGWTERKGRAYSYLITTNTTCLLSWLGQREFVNMLPLVCNDAVAILFMFDLSRKSTLNSIKEWYRQARGFNKVPYLTCRTMPQRLCHRWLFLHSCCLCHCYCFRLLFFNSAIGRVVMQAQRKAHHSWTSLSLTSPYRLPSRSLSGQSTTTFQHFQRRNRRKWPNRQVRFPFLPSRTLLAVVTPRCTFVFLSQLRKLSFVILTYQTFFFFSSVAHLWTTPKFPAPQKLLYKTTTQRSRRASLRGRWRPHWSFARHRIRLMCKRFSRLCFPRHLTSSAPSPRSLKPAPPSSSTPPTKFLHAAPLLFFSRAKKRRFRWRCSSSSRGQEIENQTRGLGALRFPQFFFFSRFSFFFLFLLSFIPLMTSVLSVFFCRCTTSWIQRFLPFSLQ